MTGDWNEAGAGVVIPARPTIERRITSKLNLAIFQRIFQNYNYQQS